MGRAHATRETNDTVIGADDAREERFQSVLAEWRSQQASLRSFDVERAEEQFANVLRDERRLRLRLSGNRQSDHRRACRRRMSLRANCERR